MRMIRGCLAATCMWALGGCNAGTGGELVHIEMQLRAQGQGDAAPGNFTTETGYEVVLEEAYLSVASVLVYAPESEGTLSVFDPFVGRAFAHGGYDPFNGRIVRVEYAEPRTVDLLDPDPVSLGSVLAEAGPMASATLIYADEIDGEPGQGWVRGSAERDGERIEFEGTLRLEDEVLLRRVDGVRAEGELVADGTLTVQLRPHVLLEEAHFDRLEPREGGPREITRRTQVHTAWVFGARSTRAFSTDWSEP